MIANPILRGMHPDPCLIRVGNTYYCANSTFEWWPGVTLSSSTDLAHWTTLPSPLTRTSQLDMRGNSSSFGVWAPDLTCAHSRFWLVYTDVKSVNASFTDCTNYLIAAPSITGPWSDPIVLDDVGFDARLFHDTDGKTYLVQQTCDFREYKPPFAGITLIEFDVNSMRLLKQTRRLIWKGSGDYAVEGPHLYHINGYYYLFTAEGGTSYQHRVSVARSRTLEGPFETMPNNPLLTSIGHPDFPLQKQGHASLVSTPNDEWYIAYLCARPWHANSDGSDGEESAEGWCTLGRETALQRVEWDAAGWPRVLGGISGLLVVPSPGEDGIPDQVTPSPASANHDFVDDLRGHELNPEWKTLRRPFAKDLGHIDNGGLTLVGRQSLCSSFDVALVARSWRDFYFDASMCISFQADSFQQMAGLTNYYGSTTWSGIFVTWDDDRECRTLEVAQNDNNTYTSFLRERATQMPADCERVMLRTRVRESRYTYDYAFDGDGWQETGVWLDAKILTDDYAEQCGNGFFAGAFVGLFSVDMTGFGASATFTDFKYPARDRIESSPVDGR